MAEGIPLILPFRAEYAKTGRGSCQTCKSRIEKDELKLAVMVQSRFHDGKDAKWSHVDCFFNKQRPKSVGDFSHFEQLRWEDQERIKKKIAAIAGGGLPGKKGSTKEVLSDFVIGYAKSAASTCQACEEKIPKKAIRISKKDHESERALMFSNGAGLDRWHHLECFVKIRNELEFFAAGNLIPGFKDLDKEDKAEVNKVLPKITPPAVASTSNSSKRKLEDTPDGKASSSAKKSKKEAGDSIEELMKKQNKQMFAYRDALKDWKKGDLQHILSTNKQEVPGGGPDKLLDRITDIMVFGALKPHKECKGGQYVYRSGVGYQCLGYLSEYTKCMHITSDPERVPFKVPNDYRELAPFNKYKFKPQKRAIQHATPTETLQLEAEKKKPKLVKSPLKNFKFMIVGVDTKKEAAWTKKIEEFGGEVKDYKKSKTTKLAAIISTEEEVKKSSSIIKWAEKKNIPVVKEDFVEALTELNYKLPDEIKKNLICTWANDILSWLKSINSTYEERGQKPVKEEFEKKEKSVKLKMKGGAVVDPESDLEEVGHVLKEGKLYYNCVLNRTSLEDGTNSYYKIQVIESDKGKSYWVFKAWGRIGTTIGGKKVDEGLSKSEAIEIFRQKYAECTQNEFGEHFVKKPGAYTRLEIDYGEKQHLAKIVPSTQTSKLPLQVQELVSLIFDVDRMKQAMLEFEINLEEMPLGKISRKQVLAAYGLLSEASEMIEKLGRAESDESSHIKRLLLDASNRFYTLIPHNFGTRMPPLLDNDPLVKAKLDMLENLLEIELAYEMLLEGDKDGGEANVDGHYKTLNAVIDPVEGGSEEYVMLEKYMKNTHGSTHGYTLDVESIFKVNRKGENKRYRPFKELPNRKLLWHGSRVTNYAGILSQGLRIAPPEAPVTGYMFGKGVYFADMVTKSANYCHANRENSTGLLLVCEVALGQMHELKSSKDTLTKAPKNCHSVKGVGETEPDPTEAIVLPDGVEVPMGKPVKAKVKNTDLLYNEYIVYDTAQVNIRYLMRVNFNYGGARARR